MGSLSQPRLNIFTVGNMRVMICLGQGGLRSLSASSLDFVSKSVRSVNNCFLYQKVQVQEINISSLTFNSN